jgi:hypothetical protein
MQFDVILPIFVHNRSSSTCSLIILSHIMSYHTISMHILMHITLFFLLFTHSHELTEDLCRMIFKFMHITTTVSSSHALLLTTQMSMRRVFIFILFWNLMNTFPFSFSTIDITTLLSRLNLLLRDSQRIWMQIVNNDDILYQIESNTRTISSYHNN